jgi:hypothetical protein
MAAAFVATYRHDLAMLSHRPAAGWAGRSLHDAFDELGQRTHSAIAG